MKLRQMNDTEAIIFLAHLGDGTMSSSVSQQTVDRVNEIQKQCGVHESCFEDVDGPISVTTVVSKQNGATLEELRKGLYA